MEDNSTPEDKVTLSTAQRARIERNRLRALALRDAKLVPRTHSYTSTHKCVDSGEAEVTVVRVGETRLLDTGGGFLLEAEEAATGGAVPRAPRTLPAPIADHSERPPCLLCTQPIAHSYLLDTFDYAVCDQCRDDEGEHSLVTRTEAKAQFLLQDCDLDGREPPLRCILRSNPHNPRGHCMRLYLRAAVLQRALLVWGSEECLRAELERREQRKESARRGKYARQLRALRMDVRSSLYERRLAARAHTHRFGPEEPDDEHSDSFRRRCDECGHVETYEKM